MQRAPVRRSLLVHLAIGVAMLLGMAVGANAQDGLLIAGQFYGAVRNFGQPLGPGPDVSPTLIFNGGRYGLIGL